MVIRKIFLPGSLGYLYREGGYQGGGTLMQQDIQVALATSLFRGLSVGLGGHRLLSRLSTGGDYAQNNGTLGLMLVPYEFMGIGFVAYDVLATGEDIPEGIRTVPTFALGLHGMYEKSLRLRLDLVRPDKSNPGQRMNIQVGGESYMIPEFALRLGYQWRETEDKAWATAGFGFKGPRLSFDYGFAMDTRAAGAYQHMFDLWVPFW